MSVVTVNNELTKFCSIYMSTYFILQGKGALKSEEVQLDLVMRTVNVGDIIVISDRIFPVENMMRVILLVNQ